MIRRRVQMGQSKSKPGNGWMRGAQASLILLLLINLFNYIDRYILAAVLPRIQHDLLNGDPYSKTKAGGLATAFIVSYMLTSPIFGWLAERMSRWVLVGAGVVVWSLASGASGLAPVYMMLLFTRLFVGVGEAGYGPAAPTIISDLYPVEKRGWVLAWFYMAIPLGSAIGYVWGGTVQAWLGWRWAFYTVVPPGLLLGAVCFLFRDPRDQGAKRSDSGKKKHASMQDYLSLLHNRSYVLDCAGMSAMTFAIGGISTWMPEYLAEYRKAGELDHVNFVFGILTAISGITATLAGGYIGDKLRKWFPGSYFLVSGAGILIACPFVIFMLFLNPPWIWVSIFIAMFFLFFNTGPSNTILANVTAPSIRATAFAMNIFVIHLFGDAISPPVLGALVGAGDHWNRAFIFITVIMVFAAVLWLWGAAYLDQDTRRVESSPS